MGRDLRFCSQRDHVEIRGYSMVKQGREPHCLVAKSEAMYFKRLNKLLTKNGMEPMTRTFSSLSIRELLTTHERKEKKEVQRMIRSKTTEWDAGVNLQKGSDYESEILFRSTAESVGFPDYGSSSTISKSQTSTKADDSFTFISQNSFQSFDDESSYEPCSSSTYSSCNSLSSLESLPSDCSSLHIQQIFNDDNITCSISRQTSYCSSLHVQELFYEDSILGSSRSSSCSSLRIRQLFYEDYIIAGSISRSSIFSSCFSLHIQQLFDEDKDEDITSTLNSTSIKSTPSLHIHSLFTGDNKRVPESYVDCFATPEPGKLRRFETYQDLTSLSDDFDFDLFGSAETIDSDVISLINDNTDHFLPTAGDEEQIQSPPSEVLAKPRRFRRRVGSCIRMIGKSIREAFQSFKCW